MSRLEIWAVSWLLLTKMVGRAEFCHRTIAPFTKLEPLTVRVKSSLPAKVPAGATAVETVGTGLTTGKVWSLERPPPGAGLKIVTLKEPLDVTSEAGI